MSAVKRQLTAKLSTELSAVNIRTNVNVSVGPLLPFFGHMLRCPFHSDVQRSRFATPMRSRFNLTRDASEVSSRIVSLTGLSERPELQVVKLSAVFLQTSLMPN